MSHPHSKDTISPFDEGSLSATEEPIRTYNRTLITPGIAVLFVLTALSILGTSTAPIWASTSWIIAAFAIATTLSLWLTTKSLATAILRFEIYKGCFRVVYIGRKTDFKFERIHYHRNRSVVEIEMKSGHSIHLDSLQTNPARLIARLEERVYGRAV
ncbi:MAG: hypothetical protein MK080_05945 [Opitutales bacterium]|nr:hypothetical protein [Opitutales bacterium]